MNDAVENTINSEIGERLTFSKIFDKKNFTIEIPIIQRDYAQGRATAKEIRDIFLDTLFDHLSSGKNIDLDFVYGSLVQKNSTKFIPLDGQQRLTTLFLLHWYLANKDSKVERFKMILLDGNKSKFTYETRTSSREFCDGLVNNSIDLNNLLASDENSDNRLSKTIKDKPWYFLSWDNDPSIKSMLTMLDAIHQKFADSMDFFDKLTNDENPVITFQFLNLKEFKLTDDLYIKMNARGKTLTPFENFKAKFEQLIKETNFNTETKFFLTYHSEQKEVSVQEYFSHRIDTDWANLFWNYRNKSNLFDEQLMNFIRVILTNHFAMKKTDYKSLKNLRELIGDDDQTIGKNNQSFITFSLFKKIGCFDIDSIIELIRTLDIFTNGNNPIKKYLSDENKFFYDEEITFRKAILNTLNYTERVQFYSFYKYLLKSQDIDGLKKWMRVIHNLTENTIYNVVDDFRKSIQSVTQLLNNTSDILTYLNDHNNNVDGFNFFQIQEERVKAILILKSEMWANAIIQIEKHEYFKGQISFLLQFAGILDYYKKENNCEWSNEDDKSFFQTFNNYIHKALSVFETDGLKSFKNYVWERALLSKGNYLLQSGANSSFLINKHRDISWKRLLRGTNRQSWLIKELFDDINFNTNEVQNSLETIIKSSVISEDDWRCYFVELPEIINYLGNNRYVRIYSDHSIYLLEKERMNGKHGEYYTFGFYQKYLKSKKYLPFTQNYYFFVNGDDVQPRAVIDNWEHNGSIFKIEILYSVHLKKYTLKFIEKMNKPIEDSIKAILESNGFKFEANDYAIYLSKNETKEKLEVLCELFNKL